MSTPLMNRLEHVAIDNVNEKISINVVKCLNMLQFCGKAIMKIDWAGAFKKFL